jgi:preprotein translocase subunit SecE
MSISDYIKETRAELTHVNWPTREQTIRFTVMVVVTALVTAIILGLSDFVFSRLLTLLFK